MSDEEADYQTAQNDPLASVLLKALHEQDARTYHGRSGNMGALALTTAEQVRVLFARYLGDLRALDPSSLVLGVTGEAEK